MRKSFFPLFFSFFCLLSWADGINPMYENQRKFDYFFLEALQLKEKGEHSNAFNTLQYALKIDSTSSSALYELSHYYLFLKKDSLALEALQNAVKYSPDNFEYKISFADLCRETKKYKEAIALYEELIKEYPNKPEIHFYLSELYSRLKQTDKAVQSLDDLENSIGMNESISIQKYQLYNQMEENEKAVKEIEKLCAKFPMEAKYPIIIGDFYMEQGAIDKALEYYESAYKLDPNNPYYFLSMSNYYERIGNEDAATEEIDKALQNSALDIDIKLRILGRYIQNLIQTKKEVEKANALLETLIANHSQEKELNLIYGDFLLSQNKIEDAKFQFQIVTEANPEIIDAWRKLLGIALKENNMDEVISICDGAFIYFPDVPEFYLYKGIAYSQKKEYAIALETLSEGLSVVPEENIALLSGFQGQIGDLYYQINEKEKAYQAYDKSLEYNESNLLILNNYAYFLSLDKKDLDKAERMSAKCVRVESDNPTYMDTYAWIFFQKGNYSLAKFYIESALSKGGDKHGDIHEHYGDILFKSGNIDKAVTEWEKALELKGDEEDTTILKKKIADKTYYEGNE